MTLLIYIFDISNTPYEPSNQQPHVNMSCLLSIVYFENGCYLSRQLLSRLATLGN